ncbi:MAG: hypothetical protein K2N73_07915 [Lachnospiraceae bacterium]|nr:hypothetical protein [Lachnospiraceae bacterium]
MKVKVIKKLMAYLLVGAMVISTPITASATEASIADVYTSTDDADKSSGTATLSSTETGTYKFEDILKDPEREAQVIGLALDKTSLSLEVNGAVDRDRLQARVLYSDYDPSNEEMVLQADEKTKEIIDKYLRWEVLGNEDQTVGISYYQNTDGSEDTSMVNVRAKKGGQVTVRAFIDYNANTKLDSGEFYADAVVSVKEFASSIAFSNLPEKFYLKQTYDLNQFITVTPSTATCNVSFYVGKDDQKKVTIADNGKMTVKKAPAEETIKLYAVTENGCKAETEIVLNPGVAANKVEIKPVEGDNILDYGKLKDRTVTLQVNLIPKNTGDVVTDSVEWSVKNPKTPVVRMTELKSDSDSRILQVQIDVAEGVGTATVTAKASSGKKATYKITVNSTPSGVAVADIETWTGAKPSLTAVLYADDCKKDSDGNVIGGTVIPVGKTKVSFSALKGNAAEPDTAAKNVKNIKVNGKGVVTSANLLVDTTKNPIDEDNRTIKVSAKFKDGTNKEETAKCNVKVKQADIKNITVTDVTHGAPGTVIAFNKNAATASAVSGGKYRYQALAFGNEACTTPTPEYNDAIVWASSSAKVGTISENGQLSVLKGGTTKVTASYVTINEKNGKKSAKVNKKTITVKAVQKATSLTLNKNVFVVVANSNAKDIAINVKKQLPSGSKDLITWKKIVGEIDENGNTVVKEGTTTIQNASVKKTTAVKVPVKQYSAGTVIKVGAYADGGAVAYAYIYVVGNKTKAVRATENGTAIKKKTVNAGDQFTIVPQIQSSVRGADFANATVYTKENIGYGEDPVTYSFNKAGIASIDNNGVITAMKPGKTTLTIKTLSGKKATVAITVQ